jgi:hypothetical protein
VGVKTNIKSVIAWTRIEFDEKTGIAMWQSAGGPPHTWWVEHEHNGKTYYQGESYPAAKYWFGYAMGKSLGQPEELEDLPDWDWRRVLDGYRRLLHSGS